MGKEILKIRAILHGWATTNRIKMGFLLNNKPKRAKNMPG